MANQPTPNVTDADVERVVRRDYDETAIAHVLELLAEYDAEHRESARVRLAVLKLADGSVHRLRTELETARHDYRDVLASAEYPAYCKRGHGIDRLPEDEVQRIVDADWQQYGDWLTR